MKLVPPKFSKEEKELYNRYFARYFKPNEFKKLVSIARRRVYRVSSTIINQGNGFESLFFIVSIPTEKSISVELRLGSTTIKNISNDGWIGIVEYTELISKTQLPKAIESREFGIWGINVCVSFGINDESEESYGSCCEEDEDRPFGLSQDIGEISVISAVPDEVVVYEFDLEVGYILYIEYIVYIEFINLLIYINRT